MKVKINDSFLGLEFDLKCFKEDFGKGFDLEKSVYDNISIKDNPNHLPIEEIKKLLYLGFDWGGFFRHVKDVKKNKVKFKVCDVSLSGFKQIIPKNSSYNQRELEFEFKEIEKSFVIINDAIPHPDFSINNMFCKVLFNFGQHEYLLRIEE